MVVGGGPTGEFDGYNCFHREDVIPLNLPLATVTQMLVRSLSGLSCFHEDLALLQLCRKTSIEWKLNAS